ncbi:MAG: hypothetical protein C6Y22_22240 [Hapalosiphonaceae cyanobacterium JJU2]|nr:MAG: hypothetical protein C6Y22_22240 [Hapalosiphonaceae cyanobacterium JJU2]
MTREIILSGREEHLKPVITLLLGLYQILEDRDIGQFVGESIENAVRASPHTIRLTVTFYSVQNPPWRTEDPKKRLVRAVYNIPDVKRSNCDWKTIKNACGGNNGYMWGRFKATANLSNGRQMQVNGATEKDAEERLKQLAELGDFKLTSLSITEEKKEGRRAVDQWMYKESTRVYPAYFSIINSKKIIKESGLQLKDGKRRSKLSGDYVDYGSGRIHLWMNKEPSTAKAMIQKAFTVPPDDT